MPETIVAETCLTMAFLECGVIDVL